MPRLMCMRKGGKSMKSKAPPMKARPKPIKPIIKSYTQAEMEAIVRARVREATYAAVTDCVAQLRDLVIIAVSETFGAGPVRMERFLHKLNDVCDEYADLIHANSSNPDEVEYARAKVDERLKPILGAGWAPFEKRYPDIDKRNNA